MCHFLATKKKTSASGTSRRATSSGRKKTTTTSRSTRGKPSSTRKKQAQQPLANSYLIASVFLLLALVLALALFRFDGLLLGGLLGLFGGLIGWGTQPCCIALCIAGIFILCDPPAIRLRVVGILLVPMLLGALVQCIQFAPMALSFGTVSQLWNDGQSLVGGGVLGGLLSAILSLLVSAFGTKLILLLLLLIDFFLIANTTPLRLVRSLSAFLEDDVEALQEDDMTVTPTAAREKTQARSFFAFLRDRRARRRAKRLKAQQDKAERERRMRRERQKQDEAARQEVQQATAEAQEQAAEITASRERYAQRMASRKRLKEVIPPEPGDLPIPNIEPDVEEELTPLQPDTPSWEDDIPPWEQPEPPQKEEPSKQEVHEQMQRDIDSAMTAPVPDYQHPSISLLKSAPRVSSSGVRAELKENSERLVDTLASFGIDVEIINIVRGPSVTRYEVQMERGVKFSRITSLSDDIALSLGADSVRIAPIPDKIAIGIEVPNKAVQMVMLRDVLASPAFEQTPAKLAVALGKDITGTAQVIDLAKMPHLLIAGTTGSGKSVCINSILISLLYKSSPNDVRLIMIDPKMVELGNYNGIPHLLVPVVTDPKKASGALSWAVGEMERRYALFAATGTRNLADYNTLAQREQQRLAQLPEEELPPPGRRPEPLPQIVIVIDELADLMMVAAKEVETSICRIAQKARAAGMHLVVATQRPSADVITGIMKSNIPSRIAFAVASQVESRIILDTQGAEKLIGKGDMLYSPIGMNKPTRIQGCFVSTEEIERVIDTVKANSDGAEYSQEIMDHMERKAEESAGEGIYNAAEDEDELLPQAITIVTEAGQASTSMLQRRLKLGYSRAARLVDQMEERGIVGPSEGSKPRQVLISKDDWAEMQLRRGI